MNLDWMNKARCAETDPELFTPGQGESNVPALRICSTCEVREPCLEYALATKQSGVWGGTSEKQRQRLRRSAA